MELTLKEDDTSFLEARWNDSKNIDELIADLQKLKKEGWRFVDIDIEYPSKDDFDTALLVFWKENLSEASVVQNGSGSVAA